MSNTITVFGAKGKVGIELLKYFSGHGIYCRAVTRDLKNTIPLPYVTWMGGDLEESGSIPSLVAGSSGIFLNMDFSPRMAEIQKQVIEDAKEAGVEYIVYLSYGLIPEEMIRKSNSPVHQQHIQVEQHLIKSGLPYTILRPSGFMQSWLTELAPGIIRERKIYEATGDGKLPYIDTRDIAEVIAIVLSCRAENHYNKIYELTGNEPVSFYQVADAVSHAIDDTVTYIPETPEDTRKRFLQKAYPEWAIELLLYFAQCQKEGKVAHTTNTVKEILGRPARDIYAFAHDYAAQFK